MVAALLQGKNAAGSVPPLAKLIEYKGKTDDDEDGLGWTYRYRIGATELPDDQITRFYEMPKLNTAEADTYLCDVAGFRWDTRAAIQEFAGDISAPADAFVSGMRTFEAAQREAGREAKRNE